MQCNQICRWNDPSDGCIKPIHAICRMSNIASKKQTNADRIRAMSDEELARFIATKIVNIENHKMIEHGHTPTATQLCALEHSMYCTLMRWLKQPAESVNDG